MFSSTIIPTIGRDTLTRAVESVLEQSFTADTFEVIVVNDTGRPLPPAPWQNAANVRVITTNKRERCVARNTGAAVAHGHYLHFLDDDDWLLPGALQEMWQLAQAAPQAHWLYGGAQLVDRRNQPLIELYHGMNGNCFVQIMAGEWMPLQTSFIQNKAFFAIGGFHPLVLATQDVDLCRRISLHGDLAESRALVACIGMGTENSSTDYARAYQYSRWAREQILDEPGVFSRLRGSADTPYWQGRMVRAYLTSAVWNLQRGNGFTAVSRTLFGLAALTLTGLNVFSPDFWRAISKRYVSRSFLDGFDKVEHLAVFQ